MMWTTCRSSVPLGMAQLRVLLLLLLALLPLVHCMDSAVRAESTPTTPTRPFSLQTGFEDDDNYGYYTDDDIDDDTLNTAFSTMTTLQQRNGSTRSSSSTTTSSSTTFRTNNIRQSMSWSNTFAAGMMYDASTDRIYVTGSTYKTAMHNNHHDNDKNAVDPPLSDCFLGILQLPRQQLPHVPYYGESINGTTTTVASSNRSTTSNDSPVWVRRRSIGVPHQAEACSAIHTIRHGNNRKLYLTGHSVGGVSVLQEQSDALEDYADSPTQLSWQATSARSSGNTQTQTTTTTNSTSASASGGGIVKNDIVVYGLILDLTWYADVKGGYIQQYHGSTQSKNVQSQSQSSTSSSSRRLPVHYPVAITSGLGQDGSSDVYVASLNSKFGTVNPAYTLHVTEEKARAIRAGADATTVSRDATMRDVTTAGGYLPPQYGDRYSMHIQRLGRRAQSTDELFTVSTSTTTAIKTNASTTLSSLYQSGITNTTNATMTSSSTTSRNATSNNATNTAPEAYYEEYSYLEEPLVERWGREFATREYTSVQVASVMYATIRAHSPSTSSQSATQRQGTTTNSRQPVLLIAGSTRGSGAAMGGSAATSVNASSATATASSMHGFVTVLDASTGMVRRTQSLSSHVMGTSVRVLGMCQQRPHSSTTLATTNASRNKPTFIYLVGMTDGRLDDNSNNGSYEIGTFQAFIQKINVASLTTVWTRQLRAARFNHPAAYPRVALGSVHGLACAVTPDGSQVYMAGTVRNGASMATWQNGANVNITASFGRDDMFVAQLSTGNGSVSFVRQLGTDQDDRLATGEALVCDKHGNAILLGNTRGSFVAQGTKTDGSNDIVLLSINRINGTHADIGKQAAESSMPSASPSIATSVPTFAPRSVTNHRPLPPPVATAPTVPFETPSFGSAGGLSSGASSKSNDGMDEKNTKLVRLARVSVAVTMVVLLTLTLFAWRQSRRQPAVPRHINKTASDFSSSWDRPIDAALLSRVDDNSDDGSVEIIHFYTDDVASRSSTVPIGNSRLRTASDTPRYKDSLLRYDNV